MGPAQHAGLVAMMATETETCRVCSRPCISGDHKSLLGKAVVISAVYTVLYIEWF